MGMATPILLGLGVLLLIIGIVLLVMGGKRKKAKASRRRCRQSVTRGVCSRATCAEVPRWG